MNAITEPQGWLAQLQLGYKLRGDKTRLVHSKREGPLAVQRAFYPEGEVCHTYLLHPPGGVVAGDQLNIDLHVESGAKVLLTTPGATKFYRSKGAKSHLKQTLCVEAEGSLEWMPLENIYFNDTNCEILTEVYLASGSKFIGWEINCFGRPSNAERFSGGALKTEMRIYREGSAIFFDRFQTQGESMISSPVGLRGISGCSMLVATVDDLELVEQVQTLLSDEPLAGATLVDGLLVVRFLCEQSHHVVALFTEVWRLIRPRVSGLEACLPRIWAT